MFRWAHGSAQAAQKLTTHAPAPISFSASAISDGAFTDDDIKQASDERTHARTATRPAGLRLSQLYGRNSYCTYLAYSFYCPFHSSAV